MHAYCRVLLAPPCCSIGCFVHDLCVPVPPRPSHASARPALYLPACPCSHQRQPAHPPCLPHPFVSLPAANSASLEVNYLDIANTMPVVAIWLADHPREMLPILGDTAK